jgi:ribonucleoside-diphosphate reductase alpha chain
MSPSQPAQPLPEELSSTTTENARLVLARRYLKKDEAGDPIEEPETMFWRVARVIAEEDRHYGASEAAVEELARQFYDLMTTGKFEPNSPTLMNAGRPLGQLSACFVLPGGRRPLQREERDLRHPEVHGARPPVRRGHGILLLADPPTGDNVRSTMGVASGPVSFMRSTTPPPRS